jgi:hypothetical protein
LSIGEVKAILATPSLVRKTNPKNPVFTVTGTVAMTPPTELVSSPW